MQTGRRQHRLSGRRVFPNGLRRVSLPLRRSPPLFPVSNSHRPVPSLQRPQRTASSRIRLGAARAQIHENYIVAQTETGLVIVDQHAAHERLVYEALRKALNNRRLPSQVLLIPEIIDLPEEDCDRMMPFADELAELGLVYERFGPGCDCRARDPGHAW